MRIAKKLDLKEIIETFAAQIKNNIIHSQS